MKRLAILLLAAILLLGLSGLGVEDRRRARQTVGDAARMAVDIAGSTYAAARTRIEAWRGQAPPPPAGVAAPATGSGVLLTGTWAPVGDDAAARLGEATFEHADIRFSRGLTVHTAPHRLLAADQAMLAGGAAWTRVIGDAPAAQIEVRRVTGTELARGADAGCGPGVPPGWIAIRQQPRRLTLMLFRGEAAPGATLDPIAYCGGWAFDARD